MALRDYFIRCAPLSAPWDAHVASHGRTFPICRPQIFHQSNLDLCQVLSTADVLKSFYWNIFD